MSVQSDEKKCVWFALTACSCQINIPQILKQIRQSCSAIPTTWLAVLVCTLLVHQARRRDRYQTTFICGGGVLAMVAATALPLTDSYLETLEIYLPFMVFFTACSSAVIHQMWNSEVPDRDITLDKTQEYGKSWRYGWSCDKRWNKSTRKALTARDSTYLWMRLRIE